RPRNPVLVLPSPVNSEHVGPVAPRGSRGRGGLRPMHTRLLAILRCPYCGSRLSVAGDAPQRRRGDELDDGILSCECSTFPVVAGIPVLHDDFYFYHMKDATHALTAQEGGKHDRALADMLRLDERRKAAFQGLVAAGPGATYRDLLDFLIPEAE